MLYDSIQKVVAYGIQTGLIEPADKTWAINRLLEVLCANNCEEPEEADSADGHIDLAAVLNDLCDCALETGALTEDSIVYRDLFDTKLMGAITPMPSRYRKSSSSCMRKIRR